MPFVEFSVSVDQFLTRCDLSCLMQDFIGSYIMMEEYFMRMMVIKVCSTMVNNSYSVGNKSACYDVMNVMDQSVTSRRVTSTFLPSCQYGQIVGVCPIPLLLLSVYLFANLNSIRNV